MVAQAIEAWRRDGPIRIAELNAWVLQTRESSELRAQAEQMGRSLLEWLRNHTTARPEQIDVLAHLQPTYPLGQSAGQRILSALAAEIPGAVDHALRLGNSERQAFSPMLAILSSQHEVQYSRLFRS